MNSQEENRDTYMGLSCWEQQCMDEMDKKPDTDVELQNSKDVAVQKLWFLFQNAATSVTQLYKDRQNGISPWVPFQTAASDVTRLYKECMESHKPVYELGYQNATLKRNKDLLSWAKKRKKHIRREDLIAYITGKNPPNHFCPRPRLGLDGKHLNSSHFGAHRYTSGEGTGLLASGGGDFDMFREALAFSGSMRSHATSSPNGYSRMRARMSTSPSRNELCAFINDELTRHGRKRSPVLDVIMDSPTHKRSRYYE